MVYFRGQSGDGHLTGASSGSVLLLCKVLIHSGFLLTASSPIGLTESGVHPSGSRPVAVALHDARASSIRLIRLTSHTN